MGFFSAITGGSKGSSQSGGFNQLPAEITGAYKGFGQQIQDILNSGNLQQMYTPLSVSQREQAGIRDITRGFTPTQRTIQSDIAMQMNPYDSYVIDAINREGQGQNSILQQNLSSAGQFGSNRAYLGANDIDLSRLQQIGQFKQGQYNTALQNSLTTLTNQRQQDAANKLDVGSFLRNLDLQRDTAGVTGLQELAKVLQVLPTQEGSSSSKSSSSNGIASLFAKSDIRLKCDIEPQGTINGHKIYSFRYHSGDDYHLGVMAQDVLEYMPEAVTEVDGFYAVDYSALGLEALCV